MWGDTAHPTMTILPLPSLASRPQASRGQWSGLLGPVCFVASVSGAQAELFGAGHSPPPGFLSWPQLQMDVCSV